ncbi:MAG: hypothetical protein KJZ54_16240, partial [Phycisphaerales bacterium]|nr:hypothetical protein [Phycisphaerales bacterium]
RRDRLVTIKEIVENPDEFKRLPGADTGVRPWWPWHDPPADLAPRDGPAGDYVLREVEPRHWVGLWRTAALKHEEGAFPDLDFRADDRGKSAVA